MCQKVWFLIDNIKLSYIDIHVFITFCYPLPKKCEVHIVLHCRPSFQILFPRYFSATLDWLSIKLCGKFQYQQGNALILGMFRLDPSTQSYGPLLVMQYFFVFALFLGNYWLDFSENLWEVSIPKGDLRHIPPEPFNIELWSLVCNTL